MSGLGEVEGLTSNFISSEEFREIYGLRWSIVEILIYLLIVEKWVISRFVLSTAVLMLSRW